MKGTGWLIGAISIAACTATVSTARHNSPSTADAIRELHERDVRAVLANDTATLMSLWDDDIVAIAPDQPVRRGREANAEFLRGSLKASQDFVPVSYRLNFDTTEVFGDRAVEWGRYEGATRHKQTGQVVSYSGSLLRVLRHTNGSWRVARTIYTVDGQPSAAAGSDSGLLTPVSGLTPNGVIDNTNYRPGTRTVSVGSLEDVRRTGHGPVPVILIAGAGVGADVWTSFMERNRPDYRMIAVTLPGYAGTAPWPLPATRLSNNSPDYRDRDWSDAFVESVIRLAEREGMERPVIVGHHTVADYLAIRLATDARLRARGLVLIAGSPPAAALPPNADPRRPGATDIEARDVFVHQIQHPVLRSITPEEWVKGQNAPSALSWNPAIAQELRRQQSKSPLPVQIRWFLEYLSADMTAEYSRMRVPVLRLPVRIPYERASESLRTFLLSHGSDSVARAIYERMSTSSSISDPPNTTVTHIRDAGIFLMLDQPDEFDAAISRFLSQLPR